MLADGFTTLAEMVMEMGIKKRLWIHGVFRSGPNMDSGFEVGRPRAQRYDQGVHFEVRTGV